MLTVCEIAELCILMLSSFSYFITIVRFIAAADITTAEGKIMLTVFEIAVLCLFLYYTIFSFITFLHFIPGPDITTTSGGKINVLNNYNFVFDSSSRVLFLIYNNCSFHSSSRGNYSTR